MLETFLLDENVLEMAFCGLDSRGREDLSAAILILQIEKKRHLVALNAEIEARYRKRLEHMRTRATPRVVLNPLVMADAIVDSSRTAWIDTSSVVIDSRVPDDDSPFVRVAIARRPLFVTNDEKLLRILKEISYIERKEIRAVTTSAALNYC